MSAKVKVISYSEIDRSIRRIKDFEPENTLLPESFETNLQRLAEIYDTVKPLLAVLSNFPLFPPTWRRGIDLLGRFIGAVVEGMGTVSNRFKAGRDL